ncbi:hypothetical protein [Pseudoalteromonas agarivorans]|uniref:Uncharacterized protein n=1 Tax=Pseudoalteromonas agarivorans TaxID=176102 RepID=A0AAD0U4C7_9GAMM|nr:hypothetical protein [Pseudoalteromonas agarivorans]AYM87029.1 hypothetical protein D9T18_10125 [Pseudoalteromonas agarivorans]
MQNINLEKSGIIFENPFKNAYNNVCLELLQLLIVVEKIKTSKEGLKALDDLVNFYSFLEKQERIKGYFQNIGSSFKSNEADAIFLTVCNVLDRKRSAKITDFFIETNSYLKQNQNSRRGRRSEYDNERNEKFWYKIAPELIGEFNFGFCSLQQHTLGYSHLTIANAYRKATKILNVIKELQESNNNSIIEKVIENYSNEMNLETSNVYLKAEHSLHIRHQVNRKICIAYSNDFFKLVKPIKELFNIDFTPSDGYLPKVEIKEEEYAHAFYKTEVCDVLTMKLPLEVFKQASNLGTTSLLSRAILSHMWREVDEGDYYINNVDDSYFLDTLSEYSFWASNLNDTLMSIELSKGRKLSLQSIIRGLEFSYWFYEKKANKKLNIGDAVKLYVEEKYTNKDNKISATTIKLSFEAIKRVGKKKLAPLIRVQLMWRLKNEIPSIKYCFCPLNNSFYEKLHETISRIECILGNKIQIKNYDDILDSIYKVDDMLKCDSSLPLKNDQNYKTHKSTLKEAIEHKDALLALKL